jgi:hypothetical protein
MTAHDIIESLLLGINDTEYLSSAKDIGAMANIPLHESSTNGSAQNNSSQLVAKNPTNKKNNSKKKGKTKIPNTNSGGAANSNPALPALPSNGTSGISTLPKNGKFIVNIKDEFGGAILCPLLTHLFQLFKRLYTSNLGTSS